MRPETVEDLAQTLVRNEVHICLSYLVSTLARGAFEGATGDLGSLCDQAYELAAPLDDWEGAAREAGWETADLTPGMVIKPADTDAHGEALSADSWQEACNLDNIEPHTREVYEHWAVSQMLGDDLAAIGEKVDFDFAGLIVWARTTTGQAIYMDSAMYEVARLLREHTEGPRT